MGDKIVEKLKIAVLGVGATGSVLAAALLSKYPDTVLIGRKPELGKTLKVKGINMIFSFSS
jgi:2-dehydropantoate 2-reductase